MPPCIKLRTDEECLKMLKRNWLCSVFLHYYQLVGRAPWPAADPLVGLLEQQEDCDFNGALRSAEVSDYGNGTVSQK
jgi:hypothetical protein